MGVVSMAWVPRIPEIKTANELSDTQFGLVLIASSVGAVLGAQLSGTAIHRFGSRPVFFVAQVVVPVGVAIMGLSITPLVLVAGLFFMGFVSMAWAPRIPEIKTANELSDTQFGWC